MRLSLDALQVLDAIDRRGSFAAAAAELHRVPSAITYTIRQLESDLDVLIFDRRGHRAALTPAGHELLNDGRQLLQAAADLETRIHQIASGWEAELRIAVDTIIGAERLFPLLEQFYAGPGAIGGTRIKLSEEVLAGTWDALVCARADLVIGVNDDVPPGGGFATLPLQPLGFVFVAAPAHPLCRLPEPLAESSIQRYRAVSIADSSRNLPPRTIGLLSGQEVLSVPTMRAKIAAHIAGLGVGYLPTHLAAAEIAAGRLRSLRLTVARPDSQLNAAWRPRRTGKALRWFAQQLAIATNVEALFPPAIQIVDGNMKQPSAVGEKSI
jgi:DNA-binding transcriptional LysR family regulator